MEFFKKLDLKTLAIIILVVVIFLMRMCNGGDVNNTGDVVKVDGKKYEVIKHEIDTITVPVIQTEYRDGKTIYSEKPVYINVLAKVDTLSILKDYYAKYNYKDTLKLKDSLGYIAVFDTITQNKILNRVYDAHVNKVTIKETLIVKELPKNQFFIGGTMGFDKVNLVNFVGPTFLFKSKKNKVYSLGIGYSLQKQLSVQGGLYWKIGKKK
jgi:hypothetical protein